MRRVITLLPSELFGTLAVDGSLLDETSDTLGGVGSTYDWARGCELRAELQVCATDYIEDLKISKIVPQLCE